MIRHCKHHGEVEFRKQSSNGKTSYYCVVCNSNRQQKRRLEKKLKAVEYKGGKCEHCGYNKSHVALDFHHIDPTEKDADFSQMKDWVWDRIVEEIDKCLLLCANCHREEHENQRQALEAL